MDYATYRGKSLPDLLASGALAAAIGDVGVLLLFSVGGWMVIRGDLTTGTLFAFSVYMGFLYSPLIRLSDMHAVIQRASTSLEKIYEVLDTPSFVTEGPDTKALPVVQGRVEFRDVHFSYDAKRKILKHINLAIDPGTMVALVGPSGAGKSTFANLVPRFYEAGAGAVTIDGIDVRSMKLADLRRILRLLPEQRQTLMFSATMPARDSSTSQRWLSA